MIISKESLLKKNTLPETIGLMVLYKGNDVIFTTKSMNLYNKFEFLKKRLRDDSNIFAMLSQTTDVYWEETTDMFTALIYEKKLNDGSEEPEYNSLFYKDLTYLAIDFKKVPYFKIKDDTISDAYFIGPFHSRFFIWDFIITMMELFAYPACESSDFPCDFYREKKCKGYCINPVSEISDILKNNYFKINSTLIDRLNAKKETLSDTLMFNDEELIKKQILIIEKYYNYLKFFYITKALSKKIQIDGFEITIEKGLIREIKFKDKQYDSPNYNIEFRDNEYLAVEKHQLDERWIVYDYISNRWNDLVEILYKDRMDNFIIDSF